MNNGCRAQYIATNIGQKDLLTNEQFKKRYRIMNTARLDTMYGTPVPELTAGVIIGLLVIPIGAWLIIPLLIKRNKEFGYFLLWTLFVSMGVSELAHFIFPFLTNEPYGYFPGMASVIILVLLAWWGIFRLVNKKTG